MEDAGLATRLWQAGLDQVLADVRVRFWIDALRAQSYVLGAGTVWIHQTLAKRATPMHVPADSDGACAPATAGWGGVDRGGRARG